MASCRANGRSDAVTPNAKPLAQLNARQPAGCLSAKIKPGVPHFEISDRQRVVILAQLGAQAALNTPLTPEQQIIRTMTVMNCYACHNRDRAAAPRGCTANTSPMSAKSISGTKANFPRISITSAPSFRPGGSRPCSPRAVRSVLTWPRGCRSSARPMWGIYPRFSTRPIPVPMPNRSRMSSLPAWPVTPTSPAASSSASAASPASLPHVRWE
ncbi:MAG: hypothetical protein WDN28_18070 [Chthoniobacter sp.]